MSKRELIDAILQYNHTAAPEFLARFQENDLQAYLERICAVISPHRAQMALQQAVRSEHAVGGM